MTKYIVFPISYPEFPNCVYTSLRNCNTILGKQELFKRIIFGCSRCGCNGANVWGAAL